MKRMIVLFALLFLTPAAWPQMSRFQGTWENLTLSETAVTRLLIEGKTIRLFGICDQKPCELAVLKATPVFSISEKKVTQLHATWSSKFSITFVDVNPEGADELSVAMRVSPVLPSNRLVKTTVHRFRRTPLAAGFLLLTSA